MPVVSLKRCKPILGVRGTKKGRFEAREGWSEAEPFCVTVACRSALAGRPGQRRCHPATSSALARLCPVVVHLIAR